MVCLYACMHLLACNINKKYFKVNTSLVNLKNFSKKVIDNTFRHLTSTGIAYAKKQHGFN